MWILNIQYIISLTSSDFPEWRIVSPVTVVILSHSLHLILLVPRMSSLNLYISETNCAHFPVSYMVLTFHRPIFTHAFGESSSIGGLAVICCLSQRSDWIFRLICNSISFRFCSAKISYGLGLLAPRPTPNLEGQVLYSSGPSLGTCPAWLNVWETEVSAGIAPRIIRARKPSHHDKEQYSVFNPFSASCIFKFSHPEPILFIEQIWKNLTFNLQ